MRADRRHLRRGALVLGANYRALGVVRSLGRRGVPVYVCRVDDHRVASASRYALRALRWVSGEEPEQVDHLLRLARRHGLSGWTLFPSCDETALLLARHRAVLEDEYVVAAPNASAMEIAYDKRLLYTAAAGAGIDQPDTHFPRNRAEVEALDCEFPVILKPAFKVAVNDLTAAKAWRVDSRDELLARYDLAASMMPPELLMIQGLVPGDGECQLSYTALCVDGAPVASASATRVRQQPMDFGKASSHVVTTEDGDAAASAQRLLRALRYTGVVEVEFKRDSRDGSPKLLDVNARVWGWQTLCTRAGVDYPWLEWQLVHGEQPEPARAVPGVRWTRMATDLPTALGEIAAGRLSWRAYASSLRKPRAWAIHASDDGLPSLVDVPLLAQMAIARTFRRKRRDKADAAGPPREPEIASTAQAEAAPVRLLA